MPKDKYNRLLAEKLIGAFEQRGFEGIYCETRADALEQVLRMLPDGCVVSCGGSRTLHEAGIREALAAGPYNFLDPRGGKTGADADSIARQAFSADYYLMSANAITETGELVNADGVGNRVAALTFGPKNVIVVAGLNKVEPDVDSAIRRVRRYAAALTLLAYRGDQYQTLDGVLEAAEKIGNHLVVTSGSMHKGRVKVVLVGEELGY